MKTISLHVSQVPEVVTPEEITFRDEVGFNEIITMTFSGDGSRFIRAEIYEDDFDPDDLNAGNWKPDRRPIKLRDAIPMLQAKKRHGDWWNPNTKRFLGFWVQGSNHQ